MVRIFLDADACPVKEETYRVAVRHGIKVFVVANSRMAVPGGPLVEMKVVGGGFDAADDWIEAQAGATDIVVTADIPLAARVLRKGARVVDPKGRIWSDSNIGDVVASREISAFRRELGEWTGGPAPRSAKDRSRFLQSLEEVCQALKRASA